MIETCKFGVSQMVFRTNLQDARGLEIPLASFVDLTIDNRAAFGCVMRRQLSLSEIEALPSSWRKELDEPPRRLFDVFLEASAARGQDARLGFLSRTYCASLYARPVLWLPRPPALSKATDESIRAIAEGIVLAKLSEEERSFLAPQSAIANIEYQPEQRAA